VRHPNGFSSIKLQSFDAAGAHFGQPGYETDLLWRGSPVNSDQPPPFHRSVKSRSFGTSGFDGYCFAATLNKSATFV
jgi:hypothetical protein